MRYQVRLSAAARAEIRALGAHERALVTAAIEALSIDAAVPSRHKKVLEGLHRRWAQRLPVWQLTVVPFRVFYNVHGLEVMVHAVRRKPSHMKTKQIV